MERKKAFQDLVANKFQIYNSLFLTLPFKQIADVGVLLPLLTQYCHEEYQVNKDPSEIINTFFEKYTRIRTEKERISLLFKFIQYIERQVVLFDAVEDAAYEKIHDFKGSGTLPYIFNRAARSQKTSKLLKKLKSFKVKIVLTAHPTQFYQGNVLSIVSELETAIRNNDLSEINVLLQQLGRTAFVNKSRPTPYDEAKLLMWYLENVFYHSVAKVHNRLKDELSKIGVEDFENEVIDLGFWPCGDRDGNPYVTADVTLKTARQLRHKIFICYFRDAKKLRQRMTFAGVDKLAEKIYSKIYRSIFRKKGKKYEEKQELLNDLLKIKNKITRQHNGLFADVVEDFITKVKLFGFYFSSLDIRQDSRVHGEVLDIIFEKYSSGDIQIDADDELVKNYNTLSVDEKIHFLSNISGKLNPDDFSDEMTRETLKSFYVIRQIQQENGEAACNRYIISNTQSAVNVMEVYALARLCGWEKADFTLNITPLLETVEDLSNGKSILNTLYQNPDYQKHLDMRGSRQYVMLGFSDGTKDGGYLEANWSIYKAKEQLSRLSKKCNIEIVFFDGRGGPPARGGGNTNKFYSSLGRNIANHEIELTVQGQTISSNFGTLNSSQYNLEQLLGAGLENTLFRGEVSTMNDRQKELMEGLSQRAYAAYYEFKNNPLFLEYLEEVSVLKYYGMTNVGSRPVKRKSDEGLNLSDLRAIPFVGAWTQMKQNVPGFYGVGTALHHYEQQGQLGEIKKLYKNSLFFKSLIDNSMQSLCKSYFPLTSYLHKDKKYGGFWNQIYQEFELTKRLIMEISGQDVLMKNAPAIRKSIKMREDIILPLITIQQYALMQVKAIEKGEKADDFKDVYEKIIVRAFFGSINASRNAA